MKVNVVLVKEEELEATIQAAKEAGERILALSPSKIVRTIVKEYVLVTLRP
jgi:hypothetical protein